MATRLNGEVISEPVVPTTTEEGIARVARDRSQTVVNDLQPIGRGSLVVEEKTANNIMVAPFGETAPFALSKPNGKVTSINTEIKADKQTVITASNVVEGLTFNSTTSLTGEMVSVSTGGTTMFRGCTFVLTADSPDVACVRIASPAKVVFQGCVFVRMEGTGAVAINNTAANTDVSMIGCTASGFTSFGNVLAANVIGSFL